MKNSAIGSNWKDVRAELFTRMETGKTSPQLDTVLKVLASLGKTLAVVPLEQEKV